MKTKIDGTSSVLVISSSSAGSIILCGIPEKTEKGLNLINCKLSSKDMLLILSISTLKGSKKLLNTQRSNIMKKEKMKKIILNRRSFGNHQRSSNSIKWRLQNRFVGVMNILDKRLFKMEIWSKQLRLRLEMICRNLVEMRRRISQLFRPTCKTV